VAIEVVKPEPPGPLPDRLEVARATFAELPGWADDALEEALPALRRSCGAGVRNALGPLEPAAAPGAWTPFCSRLDAATGGDALRRHVEATLVPWRVTNRGDAEGLLTAYYEPELHGSRQRTARFRHPLHLKPNDQQVVDLGEFKGDLAGRKITGMVRGGRFRPYWDRSEIVRGALSGRRLEFLWVDDPVGLFFLQIQGSGRVVLPDGRVVRVGYAGQNGHDYTAIGRTLIEWGELTREEVSLQSIRDWLRAHPDRADELMNVNRSYVFFRELGDGGPQGASGVVLTPGRSIAVDDEALPYGVPVWIDATRPAVPPLGLDEAPLRRLVVAQDTGGAIRGPVRADLFLGPGREAEEIAGRMKQPLRYWLLLPRGVAPAAPAP